MIEGIESFYERFAEFIQEAISEDWSMAKLEAIFFPGSVCYEGEYTRKSDGLERSFLAGRGAKDAIVELRNRFRDAGKPLWGKMCFELEANGKFKMNFDYDDCDENGNAKFDGETELRRNQERQYRLSRV